ncbi:RnfABCDGE type electron transport complex subunit G [bacterium]|nr:RnfABCDGE type electron transport complex subunit G [bacterium]
MRKILKLAIVLFIIAAISGAILGITYTVTKEPIAKQVKLEEEKALKDIFSEATSFNLITCKDGYIYYEVYAKNKLIGYALDASGKGFCGTIKIKVGMNLNKTIKSIRITSQNETPGLGTRIKRTKFTDQFMNKTLKQVLLKKDSCEGTIDALTGATISSRAVSVAVQKSVTEFLKIKRK